MEVLRRNVRAWYEEERPRLASFPGVGRVAGRKFRNLLCGLVPEGRASRADGAALPPVAPAIPQALLKAEIECLPRVQQLVRSNQFVVLYARAPQIPWCLQEIGRLRELGFRAAGEGTGKASDVDLFDAYYVHLFVWDARADSIVGAYRLGLTDEILAHYGRRGLYTQSLFKYGSRLLCRLNPGIELGRSFVRLEYQRTFLPLLLLWRGIGRFLVLSPRYPILFGPVSISNSYSRLSRELMVEYLSLNNVEDELARHVRPRRPFRIGRSIGERCESATFRDIDDLSRAVEQIEGDRRGIPVLLRQYLKLGGRLLGFSTDGQFNEVLDGLIMVDLRASDPRLLARYMGEEGAATFLRYHVADPKSERHAS